MEEMNNYEVEKDGDGQWRLLVNNKQSICPYAGAFMTQTQMGAFGGFMRLPCTTGCPQAELHKEGEDDLKYTVHCGGYPVKKSVTEKNKPQTNTEGEPAKLITMDGQ